MASFTPDANFSPQSNPKDWAYHLGECASRMLLYDMPLS